jgi:hypothetical protein
MTVELEWNPVSAASRGARAERKGRVGEALAYYAQAGQGDRIERCLQRRLPEWPVRAALIEAAKELSDLQATARKVQARSAPELAGLIGHLVEDSQNVGAVLWRGADRVVTAAAFVSGGRGVPRNLQRETSKLQGLLTSIQETRNSLADLALSGGKADRSTLEHGFQSLRQAAERLNEEDEAQ